MLLILIIRCLFISVGLMVVLCFFRVVCSYWVVKVLVSGLGLSMLSRVWLFCLGSYSVELKWCGLCRCSMVWLNMRLRWLCFFGVVVVGSSCKLLFMFRCSSRWLCLNLSSRYLVWWLIDCNILLYNNRGRLMGIG